MGKVVLDLSMSLDGVIAVTDNYRLHDWYFGNEADSIREVIDELVNTTGEILIGRRMYDLGDKFNGFVDNSYKVPHFVLSHDTPQILIH
jgi:dihydrofolate reductase